MEIYYKKISYTLGDGNPEKTSNIFSQESFTKEQQKSNENVQVCYICKDEFENKYLKDKK